MEFKSADGKYWIDKKDYDALHNLHARLPAYMKSAEIAMRAVDCNIEELKAKKNTLAKFRRELGEIHVFFKSLIMTGGEGQQK